MSNQTLYRKYRPKIFQDVAGHSHIIQILKNQIKSLKIPHALLFTGQRGTGKTSLARIFAKVINCSNLNDAIACETCDNCVSANKNSATDIIEIDAASNSGVAEIRSLKDNISYLPINSKYKVYIIDEVHMLSNAAFNALLKTLEEPPSHAMFILATTEFVKIPATVLSRCQILNLQKINKKELKDRIKFICNEENINIDETILDEIYYLSEGSLRDALNALEQAALFCNNNITINAFKELFHISTKQEKIDILKACLDENYQLIINFFESNKFQTLNLDSFSLGLIEIIKEIIEFKLTKNLEFLTLLSAEDIELFTNYELDNLFMIADNISESYSKTKGTAIALNYLLLSLLKKNSLNEQKNDSKKPIKPIVEEKKLEKILKNDFLSIDKSEDTFEKIIELPNNRKEVLNAKETVQLENLDAKNESSTKSVIDNLQETNNQETETFKVKEDLIKEELFSGDVNNKYKLELKLSNLMINTKDDNINYSNKLIINLLSNAATQRMKMLKINEIFKEWFKVNENEEFINIDKANQFFMFINSKIIAVSEKAILLCVELDEQIKVINSFLNKKAFIEVLKKENGEDMLIIVINKNKLNDIKREYETLKTLKTLPVYELENPDTIRNEIFNDKFTRLDKNILDKMVELFGSDYIKNIEIID